MPILGRVDGSSQRLTIPISVFNGRGAHREVVVEVDTASDAELALSPLDIAELGLDTAGDSDFRFNGASYERPRYVAYVEWHDGQMPVHVVETERPAYVGMGLLWDICRGICSPTAPLPSAGWCIGTTSSATRRRKIDGREVRSRAGQTPQR